MRHIQTGKSFDKYEITNIEGMLKENKSNDRYVMTTYTTRQNVIECRYILNKKV